MADGPYLRELLEELNYFDPEEVTSIIEIVSGWVEDVDVANNSIGLPMYLNKMLTRPAIPTGNLTASNGNLYYAPLTMHPATWQAINTHLPYTTI